MSDNHEQALELREQAFDALYYGGSTSADPLLGQAQSVDLSAMEDVVADRYEASVLADNGAGPDDDDDEEDEDDDDDDDDDDEDEDEDEDDEEEDDVPGIDEEEDEDPDEEDEEE